MDNDDDKEHFNLKVNITSYVCTCVMLQLNTV